MVLNHLRQVIMESKTLKYNDTQILHKQNILEDHLRLNKKIIDGEKIKFSPSDFEHEVNKKPRIIFSNEEIIELNISVTLLKHLLYKGNPIPVCPYKFLKIVLLKVIEINTTIPLLYGKYFESKCLGTSKYEVIEELPRSQITGKKLTDHTRIDDAIERFHRINKQYGIQVFPEYVQLHNEREWDHPKYDKKIKVTLSGTVDFISPFQYDQFKQEAVIFDLKLTSNRHNCFPPFCWGCPQEMDLIQGILYSELFGLPFYYYVFDYRKYNPGYKIIPVKTIISNPTDIEANNRHNELHQSILWAVGTIWMMNEEEWKKEPCSSVCKNCPIYDCEEQFKIVET